MTLVVLFMIFINSCVQAAENAKNTLIVYKIVNILYLKDEIKYYNPSIPLSEQIGNNVKLQGIKDEVELYSVDSSTNLSTADSLYSQGKLNRVAVSMTDSDGRVEFDNLPDGRYYLRSSNSSGYTSNSVLIDLPYKKDGVYLNKLFIYLKSTKNTDIYIEPKGERGSINFIKIDDSESKMPLQGAAFKLYKVNKDGSYEPYSRDGKDLVEYSDNEGKFSFKDLEYGDYKVIETIAPTKNGYQYMRLDKPIEFKIDANTSKKQPIVVKNTKENKIDKSVDNNVDNNGDIHKDSNGYTSEIIIPKTGDFMIILFYLVGMVLFLSGFVIYRKSAHE